MAKKYLVMNTTDVNVLKTNGRIYSAKNPAVKFNGVLGQVGALKEGELELRDFTPSTSEDIQNKLPMITFAPEVIYDSAYFGNTMLGNFRYHEDLAFSVAQLVPGDAIELSCDHIVGGEDLKEGAIVKQTVGGGYEAVEVAPNSGEAKAYFKVVGVRNWAIQQAPFGAGILSAPARKMYVVELVLA